MADIIAMPGTMLPMSAWRKAASGVSTSYTHLKDYPDNAPGQAVAVCGGVTDNGAFSYAILTMAADGCVDNFAIVAEWSVIALEFEAVTTIADVVAKGVYYAGILVADEEEGSAA